MSANYYYIVSELTVIPRHTNESQRITHPWRTWEHSGKPSSISQAVAEICLIRALLACIIQPLVLLTGRDSVTPVTTVSKLQPFHGYTGTRGSQEAHGKSSDYASSLRSQPVHSRSTRSTELTLRSNCCCAQFSKSQLSRTQSPAIPE